MCILKICLLFSYRLSNNDIGSEGGIALGIALKECINLEQL